MEKREEWIKVTDRLPKFDTPVIVFCRIYGVYIGWYERLDKDSNWGNWHDGKQLGVLPPTHWMPLPERPIVAPPE